MFTYVFTANLKNLPFTQQIYYLTIERLSEKMCIFALAYISHPIFFETAIIINQLTVYYHS